MPEVTLKTPTGRVEFSYVISTPTQASAPSIDPALPTVLFLHPVYVGKIIYHRKAVPLALAGLHTHNPQCSSQTGNYAGSISSHWI